MFIELHENIWYNMIYNVSNSIACLACLASKPPSKKRAMFAMGCQIKSNEAHAE